MVPLHAARPPGIQSRLRIPFLEGSIEVGRRLWTIYSKLRGKSVDLRLRTLPPYAPPRGRLANAAAPFTRRLAADGGGPFPVTESLRV
jgi:hypothetical protein